MNFRIGFSPLTYYGLLALHLLAAISLLTAPLPLLGRLVLMLTLVVSIGVVQRDYGCNSTHRLRYFSINSQGSILQCARDSHAYYLPRLIYLSEYLLVLDFIRQGVAPLPRWQRRRTLVIAVDALAASDFSRLQRYLRFERPGLREA